MIFSRDRDAWFRYHQITSPYRDPRLPRTVGRSENPRVTLEDLQEDEPAFHAEATDQLERIFDEVVPTAAGL